MSTDRLAEHYRILHEQGFVPILVSDRFDAVHLAEISIKAGARAVEVTCRRRNVCDDIRRIRSAFPDLLLLVGSVVDDGPMLDFLQKRRPDMPSINQIIDLGVHGIVSALPLAHQTIGRLSKAHLVIPGVETVAEAVQAVEAGAHFAKFFSVSHSGEYLRVSLLTSSALHGLLPIFVTGGVTVEKIEEYVANGAAILGSGWDLILGECYEALQDSPDDKQMVSTLSSYIVTMAQARAKHRPGPEGASLQEYLDAIRHYHPF